MNQAASEYSSQNPWASREKLPCVSPAHIFAAIVVCFLCAVCIPLCNNQSLALLTLAVLFAYVALVGRHPLTVALILVTTFLVVVFGSAFGLGFTVGAVLLSSVVGCATAAFLMTVLQRAFVGALVPLAAFGVAYAVTGQLTTALAALSFLPAAALLTFATLRGRGRTTAICSAQCGLLLAVVGVFAVLIWKIYGTLGSTAIRAAIDAVREGVVRAFEAMRDYNLAAFEGVPMGDAAEEWIERVNLLYSREMAEQIFLVFPAAIAVICGIIAYEAQALLNASYKTMGLGEVLTPNARFFSMSVTSAILFATSFILTMTTSSTSVMGAMMQNLTLILMPGLCVIGLQSIVMTVRQARGGARVIWLLILAFFVCCSGGVFYMLAFWGAYGIIMMTLQKKMVEKIIMSGRGDDSSDDNNHEDR